MCVCEFNPCLKECICSTCAVWLFVNFFYPIIILQDKIFFFKFLGNKIEPALMVLLLNWGDPFKSNAKSQSIASLKSERACTGAIAFGEVLHMPFLLLPMLHYFQNAFTSFNLFVFHKNPVCVLEGWDYNSHL